MRLALFDDGTGPRIGVVRRNHIVDGRAAGVDASSFDDLDAEALQRLGSLDESCPMRNALRRRDGVRVLEERVV